MKTIKFIIATLFAVAITSSSFAQKEVKTNNAQIKSEIKTESLKVSGNCESCKIRIERNARIKGVSKATWDANTQLLTLTYDVSKAKIEDIQKKIANSGHDTEMFKADDNAYSNLPACCKYDRK